MLSRLLKYINIMFPPYICIPFGTIIFFSIYYLSEAVLGISGLSLNIELIRGAITLPLIFMIWRFMDDINDYDIDKKTKKNRPTAKGIVKLKDIKIALVFFTVLLFVVNIFQSRIVFISFVILMIYLFIMYKYFFNSNVANSIPLALFGLIIILYVLSYSFNKYGNEVLSCKAGFIIVLFYLPFITWEIARKIKSSKNLRSLKGFNKIVGYKMGPILVIICLTIKSLILIYFIITLNLNIAFLLIYLLFTGYVYFRLISFMIKPYELKSGFKKEFNIHISISIIGLFISLLIKYLL